jgi:hypothetical protein
MRRLKLALSPYRHYLEEDDNFRRWVEALERGSINTASVYFRKACYSCDELGMTPKDIAGNTCYRRFLCREIWVD